MKITFVTLLAITLAGCAGQKTKQDFLNDADKGSIQSRKFTLDKTAFKDAKTLAEEMAEECFNIKLAATGHTGGGSPSYSEDQFTAEVVGDAKSAELIVTQTCNHGCGIGANAQGTGNVVILDTLTAAGKSSTDVVIRASIRHDDEVLDYMTTWLQGKKRICPSQKILSPRI